MSPLQSIMPVFSLSGEVVKVPSKVKEVREGAKSSISKKVSKAPSVGVSLRGKPVNVVAKVTSVRDRGELVPVKAVVMPKANKSENMSSPSCAVLAASGESVVVERVSTMRGRVVGASTSSLSSGAQTSPKRPRARARASKS